KQDSGLTDRNSIEPCPDKAIRRIARVRIKPSGDRDALIVNALTRSRKVNALTRLRHGLRSLSSWLRNHVGTLLVRAGTFSPSMESFRAQTGWPDDQRRTSARHISKWSLAIGC